MITKNKCILLSILLVFLLFGSISIVSAENISDDNISMSTNLNTDLNIINVESNNDLNILSSSGIDDNSINETNSSEGSSNETESFNTLSQKKDAVIIATDMTIIPQNPNYFNITLKDIDGNPLVNKAVNISLNGRSYTKVTNNKGQASLRVTSSVVNTYQTTVQFAGDSIYNPSSCVVNIIVKKLSTKITANSLSVDVNIKKNFVVTLKDKNGNVLSNKSVIITLNGRSYSRITNSNGRAVLTVRSCKVTTYKIVTKFSGTSQYLASSKTVNLTIKKLATKITANSLYLDVNIKKNFVVTLKDKNGNVLSNKSVIITLNGRSYSRITNSNGRAVLTVRSCKVTTYKIVTKFSGTSQYLASTITNKIHVLNNRTPVNILLINNKAGLGHANNFTISLKDNKQKILSNRTLKVSLNNKAYTIITNNNGRASFNFKPTALKSYDVTINFVGDAIYKDTSLSSKIYSVQTTLTIQNNKIINEGFLRISLNSNYNYYISNKTVKISINGVNFTKTTNNEGAIVFKKNWSIGSYLISVSYKDSYCGLLTKTKNISCIKGKVINPLSGSVPLVKGIPNIDYMPSNYVWAGENNTYTLLSSQYKEVIKRDSYCLFLNNALSKYTFFKSKLEPNIYHIIKREKWNIIEKKINTAIVKANKKGYWPSQVTASIQGSGYSYSEVRDEQNTGYTCGPTSASTCTQVLRNYYNEAYLSKLAGANPYDGSSTAGLKKALETCHMSCKYFYKSSWQTGLNELAKGGCALIFHTWNHYIAIIDISPDKTKVLVSNPSGTYNEGSHGIPTKWVSVDYLYKYGFNDYDTSSLIVRPNYSLSQYTINQVNNFYKSMGGKWSRNNINERPAKITNVFG